MVWYLDGPITLSWLIAGYFSRDAPPFFFTRCDQESLQVSDNTLGLPFTSLKQ